MKTSKHISLILLVPMFIIFFMMSFGSVLTAGMMTMDGKMSDCPYMGTLGVCDMNVTQHLDRWQTLFATTLHSFDTLDLLSVTAFVVLLPFYSTLVPKRPQRTAIRRWLMLEYIDPLQLALSQGILNPKLYS